MAEGWLRDFAGSRCESLSAGVSPAGFIHQHAISVMSEVGIDISTQRSKSIRDFLPPNGTPPDVIISVCDSAAQRCPVFQRTLNACTGRLAILTTPGAMVKSCSKNIAGFETRFARRLNLD
jgi:arsenate reductase